MANTCVLDTGVFVRWFLEQDGFEHAREVQGQLAADEITVATIDFARVEVAGVLRKKALLPKLLTPAEFAAAVRVIDDVGGITIHNTTADLLEQSAVLAANHMLRMYDALFVQLALTRDLPLLTSDAKLARAAGSLIDIEVLRGVSGDQVSSVRL